MEVLAVAVDPAGRPVELTRERWAQIVGGHPELREHRDDVERAIRSPTAQLPGRVGGEVWFYLEGVGPCRYLKVVVRFRGALGYVITAFARRSMP